jgi:hypothetical protein
MLMRRMTPVAHLVVQVERETVGIWKHFQNALHRQSTTEDGTEVNVLGAKEKRSRREDFLEALIPQESVGYRGKQGLGTSCTGYHHHPTD